MIEFYPQIKSVHVAMVLASGLLFALRGLLAALGREGWARTAALRYLSYGIDTTLLTAALMLVTVLPGAVFANGWLAVKLGLLPIYIVLGALALGRARSLAARRGFYFGALLVYLFMLGVARTHQPWGYLS